MNSTVRFLAAFAALALGVFVLPYVVAPTSTILSASYLTGFNNSLAYAWYGAGLLLGGLWLSGQLSSQRVRESLAPAPSLFVAPSVAVLAIMAAHVALFAALYVKAHGFTFGEPLYFEDAAYRAGAGAVPFIDFYFFYGPLMISPVVFLARFVGLFPAYAIYYVATYIAGLYLLYVVLAAFTRQRQLFWWYALFALGFFNPITGLNYTFVRFMLPIVTLLSVRQCAQSMSVGRWLGAVAFLTLGLLCSPDVAIVSVASVGAFGVLLLWFERREMSLSRAGQLIAIPIFALLAACGAMLLVDGTWKPVIAYLRPVVTFSAGGWSTPIDPSPSMLSLVIASLVTVSLLWRAWRDTESGSQAAFVAAYAALLVLMQRASFGKSDIQHIAFSGLPAFIAIAAWTPTESLRGRAPRWIAAMLIVGVVASLQFYHAMLFVPSLLQKRAATPVAVSASATPKPASKSEVQASIEKAVQQFGDGRLYYMHRLEYFRLPVYMQHHLKPFMYQPTLASAFTAQDIDDVIGLLRSSDVVVLARRSDLTVTTPVTPLPTHWWFYLTSSPVPGSLIFNLTLEFQARLEAPLVKVLNSEYDQVFEDGDIVGLIRRRPSSGSAGE